MWKNKRVDGGAPVFKKNPKKGEERPPVSVPVPLSAGQENRAIANTAGIPMAAGVLRAFGGPTLNPRSRVRPRFFMDGMDASSPDCGEGLPRPLTIREVAAVLRTHARMAYLLVMALSSVTVVGFTLRPRFLHLHSSVYRPARKVCALAFDSPGSTSCFCRPSV